MKETDQLESQQFQRMYWESDVPVRDLRARLMKRLIYAAGLLFILIFSISAVVKFPDQIELPFTLKNDQQEEVYKFPHSVYLLEKYVNTSDTVSSGSSLIRISSPEIVEMINRYNESKAAMDILTDAKLQAEWSHRDMILASIRQNMVSIEDYQRQIRLDQSSWQEQKLKLRAELKEVEDKLAAYESLRAQSIGARFDLVEQETKRTQVKSTLQQEDLRFEKENNRIKNAISRLLIENDLATSRLSKSSADFRADSMESLSILNLSKQRILDAFGPCEIEDGSIVLKSPLSGKISFLFEGEKEIPEGTTALKISNQQQPTYGFIKCPPGVAGKLKLGQISHLKVLSFPFYEYGTILGHLRDISFSPDEKGEYNIQLGIDQAGRLEGLLQPGLTGTAVIIIEEKTLLQYFFYKVKKHYRQIKDGDLL
ncbi:MAG: hypothetical protein IPI50_02325 [Saprospiraceae bacterium]|nr:hypothetical protein [Saprospiraceae bacterium]